MTEIRCPEPSEFPDLSALCMRSKAHWGYDANFMQQCRAELTLTKDRVGSDPIAVIGPIGRVQAIALVSFEGETAHLDKLFVDPVAMGLGLGRTLMGWATQTARNVGAREMVIEADPGAVAFYSRMGARPAGAVPSGSIPGRNIPRLVIDLR
ncbi:MAG: GNAT family N-acetyltransferase [Pseudomonadota bacterium]